MNRDGGRTGMTLNNFQLCQREWKHRSIMVASIPNNVGKYSGTVDGLNRLFTTGADLCSVVSAAAASYSQVSDANGCPLPVIMRLLQMVNSKDCDVKIIKNSYKEQILSKEVAKSMAEEEGLASSPVGPRSQQSPKGLFVFDINTAEIARESSLGRIAKPKVLGK